MTLVFVTNTLNHHQAPVADEFYRLLGDDYKLIVTSDMVDAKGGELNYHDRPYLVRSYGGYDALRRAMDLIDSADVVIIGASPDYLIKRRLAKNLLTFRYSERWLKRWYNILDYPRKFVAHTMNRGKNLYLLTASAFMADDMKYLFAYGRKSFKWGYFTEVEELDIDLILSQKRRSEGSEIRIMWCSRFLKWKHPELAIKLAHRLKTKGYNFHIDMYGDGNELSASIALAQRLDVCDEVSFKGYVPNSQIIGAMRHDCHIFLLTSDRAEGWGAVLNEAMSNGCVAVASHSVGAAPYLVEDRFNGRIFRSGSVDYLCNVVEDLIGNPRICDLYAKRAYGDMRKTWSAQSAATRFISLAETLLAHTNTTDNQPNKDAIFIDYGPCSKAI